MRSTRLLPLLGVVGAMACADLEDISAFAADLQAEYNLPANVNLNNGSHLAITFQNVPEERLKLDSAGKAAFARGVATFAKAHYNGASHLQDVTVRFATVSSTGPLTITRNDAPYSFTMSELP